MTTKNKPFLFLYDLEDAKTKNKNALAFQPKRLSVLLKMLRRFGFSNFQSVLSHKSSLYLPTIVLSESVNYS